MMQVKLLCKINSEKKIKAKKYNPMAAGDPFGFGLAIQSQAYLHKPKAINRLFKKKETGKTIRKLSFAFSLF